MKNNVVEPSKLVQTKVAIVIKCLNEEAHIDAAISSARRAAEAVGGAVVLADSGSTDRTIEIAVEHDINVVQLKRRSDASCGVGAQLGYQFVEADYVYIMDGDMEIDPAFLPQALAHLESRPDLAGVGGVFTEDGGDSYEYQRRRASAETTIAGMRPALNGGGLYRVACLGQDYLTNPNLHSYEEAELGLRLRLKGYKLERLPIVSVLHHGHTASTGALLMARWRSGYLDGPGEWMASHGLRRGLLEIIDQFKQYVVVALSWLISVAGLIGSFLTPTLLILVPLPFALTCGYFLWRRKGLTEGWEGFVNMQVRSFAMVRGLLRGQARPTNWVDAVVLRRAKVRS